MVRIRQLGFWAIPVMLLALTTMACSSPAAPEPTKAPAAPKAGEAPKAAPTTAAAPAKPAEASAPKVDYPIKGKAITIIVPWPAGGAVDALGRLVAPTMEKELGVPVEVLNKAGAGGQVGETELAKSKPDGHTIGYATFPNIIVNYSDPDRKAAYGRKDIVPLALQVEDQAVLMVKTDSPFKSVKDAVDAAKAKPNTVSAGTTGLMGDDHLWLLELERVTGAKFAPVHFEGGPQAVSALLGGHIDMYVGNHGETMASVKNGQARCIGAMSKEKSTLYPDAPTLESQGYKVYGAAGRGALAPAGLPAGVLDKLSSTLKKAIDNPEHKAKLLEIGQPPRYLDHKAFETYWTDLEKQVLPLIPLAKQ